MSLWNKHSGWKEYWFHRKCHRTKRFSRIVWSFCRQSPWFPLILNIKYLVLKALVLKLHFYLIFLLENIDFIRKLITLKIKKIERKCPFYWRNLIVIDFQNLISSIAINKIRVSGHSGFFPIKSFFLPNYFFFQRP